MPGSECHRGGDGLQEAMQRPPTPSPELRAEFLLWQQALARLYPGGLQAWFEDGAERWFLALLVPDLQSPVA